jgi:hypothetical protein
MIWRVFWRNTKTETVLSKPHRVEVHAFSREDAENQVVIKHARLGDTVHIITAFCIDDKPKRHNHSHRI